jgi:hypothetical protein
MSLAAVATPPRAARGPVRPLSADGGEVPGGLKGVVSVSAVKAAFAEGLTFDEWLAVGQRLLKFQESSAWWIGDWLVYGEWRYREKYRVAVERLQLSVDRIRDYAYVAGNVRPRFRRADLTFTHHRLVAKLGPAEQERWLERAATERWTKRELADALRQGRRQVTSAATEPCEQIRLSIASDRAEVWRRAAVHLGLDLKAWAAATLDAAAQSACQPGPG